jgi:hypothetical protein
MSRKHTILAAISCVLLWTHASPAISEPHGSIAISITDGGSEFAPKTDLDWVMGGGPARIGRSSQGIELGGVLDLGNRFWLEGRYTNSSSWAASIWENRLPAGDALLVSTDRLPVGDILLDVRPVDLGGDVGPGAALWAQVVAATNTDDSKTIEAMAFSPAEPAGNSISIYAYSPGDGAGAFLGAALNGTTQSTAALAAIYDANGFSLIGISGNDAIESRFGINDDVTSRQRSLYVGYTADSGSDWGVSVKLGINATQADRSISHRARYSFASDAAMGAAGIPDIDFNMTEHIGWSYMSAGIGGSATRNLDEDWSISVSVELGAGRARGTYNASRHIGIEGLSAQRYQSAQQSFSRGAVHGRISAGLSRKLGPRTTATLEVWAAGVSAVPVPVNASNAPLASGPAPGTVQFASAGSVSDQRRIHWRSARATGIRFGLRYQF